MREADHITEGIWTYMPPEVMTKARQHPDQTHAVAESRTVKSRLLEYEAIFHFGEMGIEAYRKAQKAMDEDNGELLNEAIEQAEEAVRYGVEMEDEYSIHIGRIEGNMDRCISRWKRHLEGMK